MLRVSAYHKYLSAVHTVSIHALLTLTMSPIPDSSVVQSLLKRSAIHNDPLLVLPIVLGVIISPIALALIVLSGCCCGHYILKTYRTHVDHERDITATMIDRWPSERRHRPPMARSRSRSRKRRIRDRERRESSLDGHFRGSRPPPMRQIQGYDSNELDFDTTHAIKDFPHQPRLLPGPARSSVVSSQLGRSRTYQPAQSSSRRFDSRSLEDIRKPERQHRRTHPGTPARPSAVMLRGGQLYAYSSEMSPAHRPSSSALSGIGDSSFCRSCSRGSENPTVSGLKAAQISPLPYPDRWYEDSVRNPSTSADGVTLRPGYGGVVGSGPCNVGSYTARFGEVGRQDPRWGSLTFDERPSI